MCFGFNVDVVVRRSCYLFAFADVAGVGRQVAVEQQDRRAEDAETDGGAAFGAEGAGRPRAQVVRLGLCSKIKSKSKLSIDISMSRVVEMSSLLIGRLRGPRKGGIKGHLEGHSPEQTQMRSRRRKTARCSVPNSVEWNRTWPGPNCQSDSSQ